MLQTLPQVLSDEQKVIVKNNLDINETCMQLLNREKELISITGNDIASARPQGKLTAFKSFRPFIDYVRGKVILDIDNQTGLFKELFLHLSDSLAEAKDVSYISEDGKTWGKSISPIHTLSYGSHAEMTCGLCANEYGLVICIKKFYTDVSNPYGSSHDYVFWSLDEGKTFEPACDVARAKVEVSLSEINDANSIVIDNTTLSIVAISDVNSELTSLLSYNYEDTKTAIDSYIEDKIINYGNASTLRSLADRLIHLGYFVRLAENKIYVYYKETGTVGNGKIITVGNTQKTFSGGLELTPLQRAEYGCFDYNNTGIYHMVLHKC